MKRSKFTDEQILAIVKEGEAGRKVADSPLTPISPVPIARERGEPECRCHQAGSEKHRLSGVPPVHQDRLILIHSILSRLHLAFFPRLPARRPMQSIFSP